ncbi:alpha/beta hydrolase [Polymorphospora sp. NPDC050346]|uniref:alpha/beta hydrolase family protein n=1 Tax=Polymorphospora sp. NPDC050346 TaxID=3155780 RepID=UPI0033C04EF0
MGTKRLVTALIIGLMPVLLAGCAPAVGKPAQAGTPRAAAEPQVSYPVGVRTLDLRRGAARPLPTTVWYPSAGPTGPTPRVDAEVAAGRFPIVLYSHGLDSLPDLHRAVTTRLAAAGFVVVAPAYPYTKRGSRRFDRDDVRHQPADARHVIRQLSRLDRVPGDLFAGRLDTANIAAAGHSAGGFTTAGLFTDGHAEQWRGGIVIAGGSRVAFGGTAAPMLFVHGSADPIVKAARGRAAYDRVPWPKAFLTLVGQDHGTYLTPGRPGFAQTMAAMTHFLRWILQGDQTARQKIADAAHLTGVTDFENRL